MKKYYLFFIFLFSILYSQAQNPAKISNRLGTFNIKYLGVGDWENAKTSATKIGFRLPTVRELNAILMQTAGNHPMWEALQSQGYYIYRTGNVWIWTSKGSDESWSDYANNNMALAFRFGSKNSGSPYEQQVKDGEEFYQKEIVRMVQF